MTSSHQLKQRMSDGHIFPCGCVFGYFENGLPHYRKSCEYHAAYLPKKAEALRTPPIPKGTGIRTKFGSTVPECVNGKRHRWRNSDEHYGESGICTRCGYDAFDNRYRAPPSSKDGGIRTNGAL